MHIIHAVYVQCLWFTYASCNSCKNTVERSGDCITTSCSFMLGIYKLDSKIYYPNIILYMQTLPNLNRGYEESVNMNINGKK